MNAIALKASPAGRDDTLVERLLDEVRAAVPVVDDVIERFGARTVVDYLPTQIDAASPAWQSREDFLDVVATIAGDLLDEETAALLRAELAVQPAVLTANHHGVDFFAQSVQGSLLFSRRRLPDGRVARTVPVLACGTVPLDNLTYPMGMLVYDGPSLPLAAMPRRLPVLPNRVRRELVSVAGPLDGHTAARAMDNVRKLLDKGEIRDDTAAVAGELLAVDYCDEQVLALPDYSAQATLLNARVWRRLFAGEAPSRMVCLELERVCGRLLERDLADASSLAARVLLDPRCRDDLLARLDGERACWDMARLRERLEGAGGSGGGTVLFWGLTARLRRVPLTLDRDEHGCEVLAGVDDSGARYVYPLQRDTLIEAIRERRLLPAVYTSFLVLAMARGVDCLGGYHQAAYLPVMQGATVAALCTVGDTDVAEAVAGVRTSGYLGGMQAVMLARPEGLVPAGVLEMLAAGGLAADDLALVDALGVADAHRASLTETAAEMLPREAVHEGFHELVAGELAPALTGRAVVIGR